MALIKSVNSYAGLGDAEAYFENRLDATDWVTASDERKDQALVTATSVLDSLDWSGVVVSSSQPLAFPRTGAYFDTRLGMMVQMESVGAPQRIVTATIELALHLLLNDGVLDDSGSVTELKISTIELKTIRPASKIPPLVKTLIAPLRINGGKSNAWFRAN